MFWDKKNKDDGLPDLPPLPNQRGNNQTTEDTHEDEESHALPSFPDSPMQRGFSQSAIKEAVDTESHEEMPEEEETTYKTMEMESEETLSPPPQDDMKMQRSLSGKTKSSDVYVKVDKFVSARKALENTQIKLDEITELMKAIRETKMREEQELAFLEKEMASTKARVQEITENIFEKAE